MKQDISVVILTYNEELHIERCIKSLLSIVKDIFIKKFNIAKKKSILKNSI